MGVTAEGGEPRTTGHPAAPPARGAPSGRDLIGRLARPVVGIPAPVALALLLATAAVVAVGLQLAEPYPGHDESVYAARARNWVTGAPTAAWALYRPVGMPLLGAAALELTRGLASPLWALRSVALVLALLTLATVYAATRRLAGSAAALVAVAVALGGVTFARRLPEFLDDIPSAGLLLAAAHLVTRAQRPGHSRWTLPAAAALAVAACTIRYGATSGVLAIGAAAVAGYGPRSWLRAWREGLGAALVLGLGAGVLAVAGVRGTGNPIGILTLAAAVAHRSYLGAGLVFYARAFPLSLAGPLGAAVMVAGAAGALVAGRALLAARRAGAPPDGSREADRDRVFLGLAAAVQVLLLGLLAHGEPRFVLFPMLALTVLGADALARLRGPRTRHLLALTAVAAVPALALSLLVVGRGMAQVRSARAPIVAAVRAARPAAPCLVVSSATPEAGWASGCSVSDGTDLPAVPGSTAVYVIDVVGRAGEPTLARVQRMLPGRAWVLHRLAPPGRGEAAAVLAVSLPTTR